MASVEPHISLPTILDSLRCSQVRRSGQSGTTLHAPPQLISLHVFEDDTVAKVAVSKANLRVFCFGSCWALPLSLLLRCLALWRNANLAGGFAGRFWLWFLLFGLFLVMICLRFWTTRVLYTTAFHCLRNCKDRA